ncbi:hypothetical protein [Staphylococcus aureus]
MPTTFGGEPKVFYTQKMSL